MASTMDLAWASLLEKFTTTPSALGDQLCRYSGTDTSAGTRHYWRLYFAHTYPEPWKGIDHSLEMRLRTRLL